MLGKFYDQIGTLNENDKDPEIIEEWKLENQSPKKIRSPKSI